MSIKPLGNRVLVKPVQEEEVTKAGIILPETAKEKKAEGEIIAIGNGEKIEKFNLKIGQRVLFGKYAGDELKIDDQDYKIIGHDDLLAVIE